jgi:hypothetical protein
MVVIAGTVDAPRVLERRRVVIADADLTGSKQPYHAASELPFSAAEALVLRAIESSRGLALEAMAGSVARLRSQGHEVAGCGVVLGSGRALPGLAGILASHALIHTAEGEMFRDVLVWAAGACGLAVKGLQVKAIDVAWLKRVASFGRLIGPPWTLDQKYATAAALSALHSQDCGADGSKQA